MEEGTESVERLQGILQQRNYLKNMNPRDPLNVNLRKAFLEYDKDLYVLFYVWLPLSNAYLSPLK